MCCRTLYSHLGGVLEVKKGKNALLAMKHGFAYALCCTPRRPQCSYITRRPCRLLYWEGKQRVELYGIIFSRDDFSKQHQKLSFWGFGVAEEERMGDKIDEWQIDGFHSSTKEKNKKDAHVFFVLLLFWEFEKVTYDEWKHLLRHHQMQSDEEREIVIFRKLFKYLYPYLYANISDIQVNVLPL